MIKIQDLVNNKTKTILLNFNKKFLLIKSLQNKKLCMIRKKFFFHLAVLDSIHQNLVNLIIIFSEIIYKF